MEAVLLVVVTLLTVAVLRLLYDHHYLAQRVRELGWRTAFLVIELPPEKRAEVEEKVEDFMRGQYRGRLVSDPRGKL